MKQHILIADSDPTVAYLLSELLKRSNPNYCTRIAHSGEEALEILGGSKVDLLVADQFAPGISGLELLRRARTCNPQTRAILMTTYADRKVEAQARRLSACCCTYKLFSIEKLRSAVRKVLAM